MVVYWGRVSPHPYPHPGEDPEAILAGHALSCFRLPFPPGDRVTFNGKECMCQKCSLPKTAGSSVHLSQGLWSKWAPSGVGVGVGDGGLASTVRGEGLTPRTQSRSGGIEG